MRHFIRKWQSSNRYIWAAITLAAWMFTSSGAVAQSGLRITSPATLSPATKSVEEGTRKNLDLAREKEKRKGDKIKQSTKKSVPEK